MSPTISMHGPRSGRRVAVSAALTAVLGVGAALAQAQPGPNGPPLPSAEELATLASTSAAQQVELRKILRERADALDAAREKSRAALEAQRRRDRDEFERIETLSSERIRTLLGDEGFRRYAEWLQARHRGGPGRFDDHRGPGGPGHDDGGPHAQPPGAGDDGGR